ncbi:MAG: beta-ketoacyl-[acyl-carrier-protein] synthase family protein [Cytophagales bacterium]|nr:beta-ketoacyl-[acyl-carrier-protein] synthase family protein [Cytophagales bacterium]
MERRVVITGMGVVSPIGLTLEDFSKGLRAGVSAIEKWERLEEMNYACQICARPPDITPEIKEKYFSSLTIKFLKHDGILNGAMAGIDAWTDAGLSLDHVEPDWNSGSIFGIGSSGIDVLIKKYVENVDAKQIRRLGSTMVEQLMNSGVSAYLTGFLGLGNHVTTNSSACSTGSEAVIMGYEKIKAGLAKRMICGGCEGFNDYSWAGFDAMRVLCRDSNDNPTGGSRPMNATASGFVPGAGAGALVVEDYETAIERGAPIYAEIIGAGLNSGGQRMGGTMTKPNVEGARRCLQMAMDSSGIRSEKVDLICGHLTSTIGDAIEVNNWSQVLNRTGADFPYINSLKSMIGHCLGAAGAIELVAGILQMKNSFVHASLNSEELHPEISEVVDRSRIPQKRVDTPINILAKSSFGFGDVNSCLILRNWKN